MPSAPATPAAILKKSMADTTSSVERACRILRSLSEPGIGRLTEIANATDLDKTTVLRLLQVLTRDGFVRRDPQTKRYAFGSELLLLGSAALKRFDPRPFVQPSLWRLAGTFEDTVILSIPSGIESLCADVVEGAFPIRANYLAVGSRRPLGVGSGSLALLAWIPDEERRAALEIIGPQLRRYPHLNAQIIERHAQEARERGYAVMLDTVVDRMGGIAAPLMGPDGRPVAAISIAALSERITSREAALGKALQRECAVCEVLWRSAGRGSGAARRTRVVR